MNIYTQEYQNVKCFLCVNCQRCETYDFHWDENDNFEAHIKCVLLNSTIYIQDNKFDCPNFLHKFCKPAPPEIFEEFILENEMEL